MELQFKPVPPDAHRTNVSVPDDAHRYYVWKINGVWHAMAYKRSGDMWGPGTMTVHPSMRSAMQYCDSDYARSTGK